MTDPSPEGKGFRIAAGWRVGHVSEDQATTPSGLLVPAGSEKSASALALVDVESGRRFWAVPEGAWKFVWPSTGEVVVAVREAQIIAEEEDDGPPGGGRYL